MSASGPFRVQLLGTRGSLLEPHIRSLGCETEIIESPEALSPQADIAIGSGIHYILDPRFLRIPRLGIWGFHETDLPRGRGCAPLQWTVLNGEEDLTVSFFELAEKVDTGRILGKASAPLKRTMLLEEMREMAAALYCELLDRCLMPFLSGVLKPQAQTGEPSRYRKRGPADSRLDPDKSLRELWDLLRVCDNEAFPAWFEIDGEKFLLRRYRG